jgi:hypothetical protein
MKIKKLIKLLNAYDENYQVRLVLPDFKQATPYTVEPCIVSDSVILGFKNVISN